MDLSFGIGRSFAALRARWARRGNRVLLSDFSERQLADLGLAPHVRQRPPFGIHEPTQRWLDSLP